MIPGVNQLAAVGALGLSVASFGLGGALAWQWQADKIEQCEREFSDYIQEQDRILNAHRLDAAAQRQETSDAWAQNLEALRAANAGEFAAYKRCVAAGRCGPAVTNRVCEQAPVSGGSSGAVPASEPTNAAESDAILASAGIAADCSETTLQLNTLQSAIEQQQGY